MRLAFILSEIGSGIRRNLSMVTSVILVTFISLTFVGAAGLFQLQIGQMKGYWYDRVQVTIYLCVDNSSETSCAAGPVTEDQRAAIQARLESEQFAPYVDTVTYESQEEALGHFRDQFANSPIVDSVTADQLPESFRVSLVDAEKYEVINEAFSSEPGERGSTTPPATWYRPAANTHPWQFERSSAGPRRMTPSWKVEVLRKFASAS